MASPILSSSKMILLANNIVLYYFTFFPLLPRLYDVWLLSPSLPPSVPASSHQFSVPSLPSLREDSVSRPSSIPISFSFSSFSMMQHWEEEEEEQKLVKTGSPQW